MTQQTRPHPSLSDLREQIDALDRQIVTLLDQRARLAHQVGQAKGQGPVYRPDREAQVLDRVVAASRDGLPAEALRGIYREIIAGCRNLQRPLTVAYLGPAGTYSEAAAREHFGATSHYQPYATLDEAVRAAEAGEADLAIAAIENSIQGEVTRTLDLLHATPLSICGEVLLPIHHQLLSRAADLAAIRLVSAHPQALAQCRRWLDTRLPQAERSPVVSNAEAARLAAADPTRAAIASANAADLYQLPILGTNIEDEPSNTTRFIILGPDQPAPTGHDKTSLICAVHHTPGSLHRLIAVFADHGINITRLQSRPLPSTPGEYAFYLDFLGHQHDPTTSQALKQLETHAAWIKILGSYPCAQ